MMIVEPYGIASLVFLLIGIVFGVSGGLWIWEIVKKVGNEDREGLKAISKALKTLR
jgi:hypothetical protein